MQMIAELLSKGKASVSDIQFESGYCYFDSTEVTDMLSYLTTFGKVKSTDKGWIREDTEQKAKYGTFRVHYLNDARDILESTTKEPKTVEQIVEETKKTSEAVELYLSFLEKITKYGVFSRTKGRLGGLGESWYPVGKNK
jgi:hypothetical protein